MKKILVVVMALAITMAVTMAAMANDQTEQVDVYDQQQELVKSVVFVIDKDEYFINNQTPGMKMDAKPFIEAGRTFVPVRYLSNALGVVDKNIDWESPQVTLKQPGMPVVELAIGVKEIKSNGQSKAMDVSPLLNKGRTYLPARWVAEALGYEVAWDAKNNIVLCYPKGTEKPDISEVIEYVTGETVEEQPTTPTVPEIPEQEDIVSFNGESLNPSDYVVAERKAIPHEFQQPGASIMYVTVDELKQQPVKLGRSGYTVVYNIEATKDTVYITQAAGDFTPARLILAKGNDVSVQRDNTIVEYKSNPFTHGYTVSLDADPTLTKIEDITHIMILFSNQVLAVENPLYKGAGK